MKLIWAILYGMKEQLSLIALSKWIAHMWLMLLFFAAAAQFVAKWLLSNQTDVLMIMLLARTNGTHFRNFTLAVTLHFSCNLDLIFKLFPPDSQRCSALFIAKDPLCRTNTNANIARMHAPPTQKMFSSQKCQPIVDASYRAAHSLID